MSKEKATSCIVRIGVSFGILVMDTVIAGPMENTALVGDAIAKHEKYSDR